jgi:hypothetical protein
MTKSIQSSFASRIGKAETLFNTINSFADYDPGDNSLMPDGIKARIDSLYALQEAHATGHSAFTAAVQQRQQLFKGAQPLGKTLTMVKSYVTAVYGKPSDKTHNVVSIITKISGEKPIRITNASGENSISRSERSYGAQHVNLVYLITTLTELGSSYSPSNPSITIPALTALAQSIKAANDAAVIAYQAYHPTVVSRQEAFAALATLTQRVKQMVLAQYGSASQEYKAIKGLRF